MEVTLLLSELRVDNRHSESIIYHGAVRMT